MHLAVPRFRRLSNGATEPAPFFGRLFIAIGTYGVARESRQLYFRMEIKIEEIPRPGRGLCLNLRIL